MDIKLRFFSYSAFLDENFSKSVLWIIKFAGNYFRILFL